MKFTFAKGVHPAARKELAKNAQIGKMPAPKRVWIALSQHIGAPAVSVVEKGDRVKIGSLIAKEAGFVSSNIYSSVSGIVAGVENKMMADGIARPHIVIDNDGTDEIERLPELSEPDSAAIIARIREAGIVGMGGAGFPTAVKLSPKTPVDTLIINGAECEPYITCDYRVMLEYTAQFMGGIRYLRQALGGVLCMIGIEDNKPECIKTLNEYISANGIEGVSVAACKTKYPQGAEKQLIYALTRRVVPAKGGLPADVGVIVQNVHTALSVYYAVAEGEPLTRRVMTVTGHGCANPQNLWVKIGTPVAEIIEYCGGVAVTAQQVEKAKADYDVALEECKKSPKDKALKKRLATAEKDYQATFGGSVAKLINGGPMMGLTMPNDSAASTKTMSCILMLTHEDIKVPDPGPCIYCGKCVGACPMKLVPNLIDSFTLVEDFDGAEKYGATECIGCGCCTFVCPAKRPLLQNIAFAKQKILTAKKAAAQKNAEVKKEAK